ncbi:MAG: cobalamin B12-binding domain-containing protein [Thermodesulfobacteriota bacterium]
MIDSSTYSKYFQALLRGCRRECTETVSRLVRDGLDVRTLYVDLFQRSLYEIGDLWEQNRVSVAVEHMATSITESLFPLVYPTIFSAEHIGKTAVVSCVANEYHQIGGKIAADILELNGWDAYFLGANTPLSDTISLIGSKNADLAGLSLSLYANLPALLAVIEGIRERFPSLPVIVGGQAFRFGGGEALSRYQGVTLVTSLAGLEEIAGRARNA